VVSFQEDHTDIFKAVRARLHANKGRIRKLGADYLAYALGDLLVDHFYIVLESLDEEIQKLEDVIMDDANSNLRDDIHHLKKQAIFVRKLIVPTREAISKFSKSENEIIQPTSSVFLRDLYDHTIQIMDMVDSSRDILNGLQDLYLSEISFKMNQVMQILTIITIIFVPLSFLAGLYGMNFELMPELKYKYGYFVLLGVMLIIAISLIYWFKKRKWL
jgi:magnesium transporter